MPIVKLTDKRIEKEPLRAGQLDLWDASRPGFGIRIGAKRKTWTLVYWAPNGKQKRLNLGHYPALKLADARLEADKQQKLLDGGSDPAEAKRQERMEAERQSKSTVKAVVKDFLARYADKKHKDPETTRRVFERHVLPTWKDKPIATIRRRDVIELLDQIAESAGPIAANRTYGRIRKMFNWAIGRDLIDASPCTQIELPGVERTGDRVLTEDEIRELWDVWGTLGYPFGRLQRFLLVTVQRRTEVAGMRWSEISEDGETWIIPPERSKNGKALLIPLSDLAQAELEVLPRFDEGDFVFTTTAGVRPVSGYSKAKRATDAAVLTARAEAAGVPLEKAEAMPAWVWHDLRRTCRTGIAELGVSEVVAERVLGHVPADKLRRTYNLYEYRDEKREALERWGQRLREIVTPAPENVVALKRAES